MPNAQEIKDGLQAIVNNNSRFAMIWHAVFYIVIMALMANWDPTNRLFVLFLSIPVLSVAVFAWLSGNPFNGTLFSLMTVLIFIFGLQSPAQPLSTSPLPFRIAGILMIVFGLVYPHFLRSHSILKYLYASPVGLIPCPTLSVLIGFVLLFNGFAPSVTLIFIGFGLFYGIFGVLKLAVYLDLFLVFGTITLLVKYFMLLKAS